MASKQTLLINFKFEKKPTTTIQALQVVGNYIIMNDIHAHAMSVLFTATVGFARLQDISALFRAASQALGQPDVQVPATRTRLRVDVFHRRGRRGRRLRRAATAVDRTTAVASSTAVLVNGRSIETTAAAAVHSRRRRFESADKAAGAVDGTTAARRPRAAQTLVTGHRAGVPRVHRRVFGRGTSARRT